MLVSMTRWDEADWQLAAAGSTLQLWPGPGASQPHQTTESAESTATTTTAGKQKNVLLSWIGFVTFLLKSNCTCKHAEPSTLPPKRSQLQCGAGKQPITVLQMQGGNQRTVVCQSCNSKYSDRVCLHCTAQGLSAHRYCHEELSNTLTLRSLTSNFLLRILCVNDIGYLDYSFWT